MTAHQDRIGQPNIRETQVEDPTQGQEVGATPDEDPTQGQEVGETPGEDPTEVRYPA